MLEWEVFIAARPETIFPFFTDPEKLTRWLGSSAILNPQPGGLFRVDINGHNIARGEYLEVIPSHRVVSPGVGRMKMVRFHQARPPWKLPCWQKWTPRSCACGTLGYQPAKEETFRLQAGDIICQGWCW